MSASESKPTLEDLVGKTVLIGISKVSHDQQLISQRQYVGTFRSMDQVIHVTLKNGEDFTLPPDLEAFQPARPGTYRLRSTGEEVQNPDFVASWTVVAPDPNKESAKNDEGNAEP
jgi:hypothetical protein